MQSFRVLVIGNAGYIGSVLTGMLLEEGAVVTGVDNLMYDNKYPVVYYLGNENFNFVHGDIRRIEEFVDLYKYDVVIPLAAIVGAPICKVRATLAEEVNSLAIANLVKKLSGGQRLIFPMTNSGYGATDGTSECTEDSPLNPVSIYGQTKAVGERAVLDHPNSVSLRLATVFGASPRMRMDLMVNDFVRNVMAIQLGRVRSTFKIFQPTYLRNFVHVRDVCRAMLFMANRPELTGVFNCGLPEANLDKLQLVHKICDQLFVPREVVEIGEGKDEDNRNYIVSNAKLLSTGFTFEKTLEDGIQEVKQICKLFSPLTLSKMRNV